MPSALDQFIANVRSDWGPISTTLVQRCRAHLAGLTLTDPRQEWLAALHSERPAARELHRDPAHGFMLLAHTETRGLYRPPHDHGRSWVVYAVQSGELEVSTYAKLLDANGQVQLVRRETNVLRPGAASAYLPGDIHDTRCSSETALLFRFTERDLRHEDQVEHKLTRFVERDGNWTTGGA
ncbi:hypothetical protein [Sphingosinicella rhizophila]|uniref:Cysteine dioxygenase n=1 Tax=Sphingosinicella rhizophila TaxID=3050082 RepID=A0ABU3QAM3_9SPHN|nr:hypothetical protein [Sphingosinicella sp. GR2756]MDT9600184.1 hypothetical protein [Sphingosinicella sp. GR2756]